MMHPAEGVEYNKCGDYPEAFVKDFITAAIVMLTNESARQTHADMARAKMLTYTWERAVDEWIARFAKKD